LWTMATDAGTDRGNSGRKRATGIKMTVLAGNSVLNCMKFVAEGNGLLFC